MARSPLAALLSLVPLALALAACSGRGGGNESADTAGNGAEAAEAANKSADDAAFAAETAGGTGKAAAGKAGKAAAGKAGKAGGGTAAGETLLGSETVKARFGGFLGGHVLDAKLGGPGYRGPKRVLVESAPVAAFLHVHRGETLTLRLDRIRRPHENEPEEYPPVTRVRIASAQAGAANSDSYWRTLNAEEKECATRSLDGMGRPCNGDDRIRKQGERG